MGIGLIVVVSIGLAIIATLVFSLFVSERKAPVFIVGTLMVLLALAFFAPIVPDDIPVDMWEEQEFNAMKPRIEAVAVKLNSLTKKARGDGYDLPKTYNLVCDFGFRNSKHSFLGSFSVGDSHSGRYAFGTVRIRDLGYPRLAFA
jgi:hypothetical protein